MGRDQAIALSEYDLDGWCAIATFLRRSESTVRRWARLADPLPVQRVQGAVLASSEQVERWLLRRVREGVQ